VFFLEVSVVTHCDGGRSLNMVEILTTRTSFSAAGWWAARTDHAHGLQKPGSFLHTSAIAIWAHFTNRKFQFVKGAFFRPSAQARGHAKFQCAEKLPFFSMLKRDSRSTSAAPLPMRCCMKPECESHTHCEHMEFVSQCRTVRLFPNGHSAQIQFRYLDLFSVLAR
jgi:hypothetical protein